MKLYYSPGACSLAPHVLLREIGQPFELVEVNTARSEHLREDYLRINPRGRVPALEAGGMSFTEGPAILTFLALRYPELHLFPEPGSPDVLRCLEWLAWFSSSLHVAYLQLWRPERHLPAGSDNEQLAAHARTLIDAMNADIEERLIGPWFLGEHYSIVDIYALVFYGWGHRLGIDMETRCPGWTSWSRLILEREPVRDAIVQENVQSWFPALAA